MRSPKYIDKIQSTRYQLQGKKKNCKNHKHMEIKQNNLNNEQVIEEIKGEIKRLLETNDYEKMTT